MKSKKLIVLTLGASLILSLASCSNSPLENNDTEQKEDVDQDENSTDNQESTEGGTNSPSKYTKRNVELFDLTDGALGLPTDDPGIETYFKENGHVPYIGIKEFVTSLEGFFLKDYLNYDIDKNNQIATISYKNNAETKLIIDCKSETIRTNVNNFFEFPKQKMSETDHKKLIEVSYNKTQDKEIVYDLKKYDVDAFIADNDVILPFTILNPLALTINYSGMLYNDNSFYIYPGYIGSQLNVKEIIKNKNIIGKEIPTDVIEARNNGLYFTLDTLYGLKKELGVTSFKDYVEANTEIKTLLNSNDTNDTHKALSKLLIGKFDDPHTDLRQHSFYKQASNIDEYAMSPLEEDIKTRNAHMQQTYEELDNFNNLAAEQEWITPNALINSYDGETAFIKFDEFKLADDSLLFDDNGDLLPDAYLKDTFYMFDEAFNLLKTTPGANFKNVVIDLSMNGGGAVAQSHNLVGFLTNKMVAAPKTNLINNQDVVERWGVDTNFDENFTDNDAYTEYNYFILTSNMTFSAANYFTAMCKDMGVAKIIGEQSGGGQCCVFEPTLLDGTIFGMSGPHALRGAHYSSTGEPTFYSIENGVQIDMPVDREDFYNLPKLTSMINKHYPNAN